MADLRGFDANQVEPSSDFEPIPSGTYEAVAIESETRPTKSGNGSYLQMVFEIVSGPHRGRKLWARFNLVNSNQTTVNIARAELSSLCRAAGILTPSDSCELHGMPVNLKVGLKKRSDTQELQNEIRGYAKRDIPVAPATASPQANGTPPWKR